MRSAGHELAGAWNFRDVAEETGIRPGAFFRSSELTRLDDAGRAALSGYGITDVADLRSAGEVARRGTGLLPAGVSIHALPFHELTASGARAPHESAFNRMLTGAADGDGLAVAAARFMTEEYLRFPRLAGARHAVRRVVSLLGENRPVLAHCFAGKDRTGFAVALVLDVVGVDRSAIVSDFLRSNDAIPQLRARIAESIGANTEMTEEMRTFAQARLDDDVLGVREEYLDAAWRTVTDEYGSPASYLEAVGVPGAEVVRLRARLRG